MPLDSLGDQRQHDVAAVAVREALVGCELRRMPVENGDVLLGGRELVHGDGHQVVVDVEVALLVEVVTDPRAMGEQMLDGDVVADERKVVDRAPNERSSRARAGRPR